VSSGTRLGRGRRSYKQRSSWTPKISSCRLMCGEVRPVSPVEPMVLCIAGVAGAWGDV
jgi:hypothetical protein